MKDEVTDLLRWTVGDRDITIYAEQPGDFRIVEPERHYGGSLPLLDEVTDSSPLQTTPLFALVVSAEKHRDELGIVVVESLKIRIKIGASELSFVELVVQYDAMAKLANQMIRNLFHECSAFTRERERDLESLLSFRLTVRLVLSGQIEHRGQWSGDAVRKRAREEIGKYFPHQ